MFWEYEDVLAREGLFAAASIISNDRAALLDAFLSICEWVNITFLWRPNLPDEANNHLIELAIAANAESIITGDTRDFAPAELVLDSFRIVTSGNWLKEND